MEKKCVNEQAFEALGKLTAHERFVVSTYYTNEMNKHKIQHIVVGILAGLSLGLLIGLSVVL